MKECECKRPVPKHNRPEVCVKCSHRLGVHWVSSDLTLGAFLKRLEEAVPEAHAYLPEIERLCVDRERAGRVTFGLDYLARDNIAEAVEEVADGILYAYLETLRLRRAGEDSQSDMALLAAQHFVRAYQALQWMRRKEHGSA